MSDLMHQLERNPHGFDLFQAISLVERSEPDRAAVGTSLGLDEALRFAAQVDLGFAPSDIAALAPSGRAGPPLALRSAVMTLAGPQGPLPLPFTEMLLERRRVRDHAGLEFLDIFNQRLLAFLYRGRRKHHLGLAGTGLRQAPLLRSLDALSGLGRAEGARGPGGEQGWLRHAGVQGAAPRSMASLLAVLRDRFGLRFTGRQFVGAWHALAAPERAQLGRGRLSGNASLGARAWDQGAGLELSAPPLAPEALAVWLPGAPASGLLGWTVARHLQSDMQVVLQLDLVGPPQSRLGVTGSLPPRLGLSSWLGSPARSASPAQANDNARFKRPASSRFVLTSPAAAAAA